MREEDGMRVNIGTVRAFPGVTPDKAQALKVVEEAAEVFGAWQACMGPGEDAPDMLVDEIADCITACANLAAALGVYDLAPAVKRAELRNIERGRYAE